MGLRIRSIFHIYLISRYFSGETKIALFKKIPALPLFFRVPFASFSFVVNAERKWDAKKTKVMQGFFFKSPIFVSPEKYLFKNYILFFSWNIHQLHFRYYWKRNFSMHRLSSDQNLKFPTFLSHVWFSVCYCLHYLLSARDP